MKVKLLFCIRSKCNEKRKTCMTDILNVKVTLHKVLSFTTLCAKPQSLQKLIHDTIISQIGNMCLPAGNGDKTLIRGMWKA